MQIDNCKIKNGLKCDYMVTICDDKKIFFIELKGSDLSHAIKQIETTINNNKIKIYTNNYKLFARVILNKVRTPDLRGTKIVKFKKFIKKHGGNFKYKVNFLEEIL